MMDGEWQRVVMRPHLNKDPAQVKSHTAPLGGRRIVSMFCRNKASCSRRGTESVEKSYLVVKEELEFDVLVPFLCGEARLSPKDVDSSATPRGTGYGLIPGEIWGEYAC